MDMPILIAGGMTILASTLILGRMVLVAWQGWLDLRRFEIERGSHAGSGPFPAARIELADLKERIRKLEAIAAGVDL